MNKTELVYTYLTFCLWWHIKGKKLFKNSPEFKPYSQGYGFSSSHVWKWELDYKEGWASKKTCFRTVVLEKTLESPLGSKKIKLVNPKGNHSWLFIGRTDAEAPITLATWSEELTHWKRPSCWERLKAGGEGDDRGWDGWMASLTE